MRSHSSSKVCSSDLFRVAGRYRLAILIIIGSLAFITPSIWGQDAVLTDDAHVSTTTPATPDGGAQIMRVRAGVDRAFLKFSVNPALFPSGTVGMFVGKATLKVFVNTVNVPGALQVAPANVGTAWSEAALTNANAPAVGAVAATAGVATGEKWVTFDVTALVQQWINIPASNNGIALVGAGTTDVEIDSKEDIPFILGGGLVLSGHPAQLEITLNHAATADAASLAANATNLGGAPASSYVQATSPLLTGPRAALAGSPNYVQNTTVQQPLANFNISGNGTVGGTLSGDTLNANTQFNLGGAHILSTAGLQNTFLGTTAGLKNSSSFNSFFGTLAGTENTTGSANSFFGDTAGQKNTTGSRNSSFGSGAGFINDTASDNSMFGYHAGVVNTGNLNSFFGSSTGASNTTGNANTFVGAGAGASNTTGNSNNFFGQASGVANTTGHGNNFFGLQAGELNTTGFFNSFFGEETGFSNTQGSRNSFFGNQAGFTNSTGADNTALGAHADVASGNLNFATAIGAGAVVSSSNTIVLGRSSGADTVQVPGALSVNTFSANVLNAATQFNLGGNRVIGFENAVNAENLYIGPGAGAASAPSRISGFKGALQNTFLGISAGGDTTIGTLDTFVGFETGLNNTTEDANSFFGTWAGRNASGGSFNSFFGRSAGFSEHGDHNAYFGYVAGARATGQHNSMFGSESGENATGGEDNAFFGFGSGHINNANHNAFLGSLSGTANSTGAENTFVGFHTGITNQAGAGITLLGSNADVGADGLTNATAIGAQALAGASNTIVLGGINGVNGATADTLIGIGTNTPTSKLTVAGLIETNSLAGGVKFPDGSIQTKAAGSITGVTVGAGLTGGGTTGNVTVSLANSGISTALLADSAVTGAKIAPGQVARSINGLSDNITIAPGANIAITPVGNTLAIGVIGLGNPILNQTTLQAAANFNIAGTGTAGIFSARTEYDLEGFRVLGGNAVLGNMLVGVNAGASPGFSGQVDSFFGDGAGSSNTSGFQNSFFGSGAGGANQTGNRNSYFGEEAGAQATDNDNAFFGFQSGKSHVSGSDNSAFGGNADVADGLTNATAIGARSLAGVSNTIVLGSINGINGATSDTLVGIGTGTPTSKLTVAGLIETNSPLGGVKFPDGSIQKTAATSGKVVTSLNGLINDLVLTPGSPNVSITQLGNNIFIAAHADATAILNQTTLQSPANFNIDGTGTVGKLFAPQFVASADYREAGGDTSILNDIGGNLRVGPNAGIGPTGSLNTYVGSDAGSNSVAPGDQNSFFGYHSGQGATSGDGGNTFAGAFSGPLNHGDNNSYFGIDTGLSNDTGSNNTLIGAHANVAAVGLSNATAIGAGAIVAANDSLVLGNNVNVGIGTSAPTSRLTVAGFVESTVGGVKFPDGSIQTTAAAGAGPLVRSVNGLNNDVVLAAGSNVTITPTGNTLTISASGGGGGGNAILNQLALQTPANFNIDGAGQANIFDATTQYNLSGAKVLSIPGQDNLFVGSGAGSVPDPFGDNIENVFVGTQSGPLTTECCNAFFGNYTGKRNTTGQVNTFLGYQAGLSNLQGSNNTFVGSNAGAEHTSGDGNTFVGDTAGVADVSGVNNTFVGRATGGAAALNGPHAGAPGTFNTFLGANATATQPANLTYATAIGAGSVVDDNNKIVLGRVTDLVTVPGTFTSPSDIRLKTGIANLNYGLRDLLRLRPVTWKWKADANGRTQLGLIAQEVEPIIPELVLHGESKDHLLSMNYVGLLPIVVRAIQEQQATIDDLRKQLSQERVIGGPAISKINIESNSLTMSVIDGNITTNDRGEAMVEMPAGFQNAHSDFRYQLTVVGQFAQAIVATEITNNRFSIKTDKPDVKVSWQVTARSLSDAKQKAFPTADTLASKEE